MATGAQKHFIHGLIEQSHERVVQVRAGQSLVNVLTEDQQQHQQPSPPPQQHKHKHHNAKSGVNSSRNDNTLPGIPTMKLVYEARRHADVAAKSSSGVQSDASAMRKNLRKRGVLAATSSSTDAADAVSSNFSPGELFPGHNDARHGSTVTDSVSAATFLQYVNSKSTQVETLRQHDRRKALTKSTRKMAQLAQSQSKSSLPPPTAPESEPAKALFAPTLAVIKGKNALLRLRKSAQVVHSSSSSVPNGQELLGVKNAHFAFLDFKKDASEQDARRRHGPMTIGLDESNTSKRTPIHFGDRICFISQACNLPLSVGPNGRSCQATSLSAGPHMMFTIADFRNPSRHNAVTEDDEFWLRVDPALIEKGNGGGSGDIESELDVSHLLSETHYYLGCAGSIEDADEAALGPSGSDSSSQGNKENLQGSALSYALPLQASPQKPQHQRVYDTFRLIAIRATAPSTEYYGDDRATREFTLETNENVLMLAKWRFTLQSRPSTMLPRAIGTASNRSDESQEDSDEAKRLLLNCSSVFLSLNHFVLESGEALTYKHRGVMRDYAQRSVSGGPQDISHQPRRRANKAFGSAASWQVRLLHQAQRPKSPSKRSTSSLSPDKRQQQQLITKELLESPVEWLKRKQETVAKNEAVIQGKRSLARAAKLSYERVATQSNRKLAEIEQHKARHHVEYFQSRFHTIFEDEHSDKSNPNAPHLLPRIR